MYVEYFKIYFTIYKSKMIDHRQLISIINYLKIGMAVILDGNSEISVHVRSNLWHLACITDLFFSEMTYFPPCVRNLLWVAILYKHHMKELIPRTDEIHVNSIKSFVGGEYMAR